MCQILVGKVVILIIGCLYQEMVLILVSDVYNNLPLLSAILKLSSVGKVLQTIDSIQRPFKRFTFNSFEIF